MSQKSELVVEVKFFLPLKVYEVESSVLVECEPLDVNCEGFNRADAEDTVAKKIYLLFNEFLKNNDTNKFDREVRLYVRDERKK